MIECKVTSTPIETGRLIESARDDSSGAISVFVGTARNSSAGKDGEVNRLEYEAYAPMAEKEMEVIAEEIVREYGALNVIVHHRVGLLAVGDTAVTVVVCTPHRAEAFDASRYMIEELKKRVPIWKKEVFADGEEWVNPRP